MAKTDVFMQFFVFLSFCFLLLFCFFNRIAIGDHDMISRLQQCWCVETAHGDPT